MYTIRIIPKDERIPWKHVKHMNKRIALDAAKDYAEFSDVADVEVTDDRTGEIIWTYTDLDD